MPLDPQAQAILAQMAAAPPIHTLTPTQAREMMKAMFVSGPEEPVAHVENRGIPGPQGDIPIRIYTPTGQSPFPILVFFHGGGWVLGDLDTCDAFCRSLANQVGCVVVSVDYRLAPEHPFPAAPEDCYAATRWMADHAAELNGDASRIAVGGDSAGGNLAAIIPQMARDRGGPPLVFQLLIYPATDLRMNTPSITENGEGYGLTRQDIIWFLNHYVKSEEEKTNPLASPFLTSDLSGLPPALVITAEFDPLRDEGEAYAKRLKEAGGIVTISRYDGMIHGFVSMASFLDRGKQGLQECIAALRAAFQLPATAAEQPHTVPANPMFP